jgi:hypothetical protein
MWVASPPIGRGEDRDVRSLLGDTFTYSEARRAGLGDKRIYGLRDRGGIIALGGGAYRWSDAPSADLDLIEISERVPMATICLETALARHHLIDSIPAAIDIAIPRGSARPKLRAPIRLHQFGQPTFELGRQMVGVGGRSEIGMYSAERSLIDGHSSRSLLQGVYHTTVVPSAHAHVGRYRADRAAAGQRHDQDLEYVYADTHRAARGRCSRRQRTQGSSLSDGAHYYGASVRA